MWRVLLGAAALNAVLLGTAFAQPMPGQETDENGLYAHGFVELEYVLEGPVFVDGATNFWGEASVGYFAPATASGLRWGVDLGVDTQRVSFDDPETALWLSLLLDTQYGLFSVGAPRPAYDTYVYETPFDRLDTFVGGALGRTSLVSSRNLSSNEVPFGLRYDGQYGDLSFGVSAHRLPDVDANILTTGLTYEQGIMQYNFAYEYIQVSGMTGHSLNASVVADLERYGGFLAYSEQDQGSFSLTALELGGFIRPVDGLTLTASVLDVPLIDDLNYVLEARYDFDSGAYLSVSAGELSGFDMAEVSFGFRF